MIKEAIIELTNKKNLTYDTAKTVMDEIMSGEASPVQMSAYLTALAMKGETIEEITASAAGMREHGTVLKHDMTFLKSSEPAGINQIHLTSQQHQPRSLRQGAYRLPNTVTAQHPAKAVLQMCLKHSELRLILNRNRVLRCLQRRVYVSSLHRNTIRQ